MTSIDHHFPLPPRRERLLLASLAGIQFTHVLDFMIMMPLGPVFVHDFGISAQQFGLLVSAYTFAAAASGILGASFVDRFDRKRALLGMYACFLVATGLCALAPGYWTLLLARSGAGFFGGLIGALVFTVIGDVIPESHRGRATGIVMASFSLATIAGLPLGLTLANRFGWHAPFVFIAAMSLLVWEACRRAMPSVARHLDGPRAYDARGAHPLAPMIAVLRDANHWRAFAFMSLMIMSGFVVIPFITLYYTSTVGVPQSALPLMYFLGGSCTIFTSRWFGRLADHHGKARVYRILAVASIVPMLAITHLPAAPLWLALAISTLFFILVTGRMVPGMAMVTSAADPRLRGAFMSMNSSVTQLASGVASLLAGMIVVQEAGGRLERFDIAGYVAVAATLCAAAFAARVRATDALAASPPRAGAGQNV